MVSKMEFDKIEGRFHDGLGTFAELRLGNTVIKHCALDQPLYDESEAIAKMDGAIESLEDDPRSASLRDEARNVEAAVERALDLVTSIVPQANIVRVEHTAHDIADGKAADLAIHAIDRAYGLSVKTDKSSKIALADVGQTSIERFAHGLYGVSTERLEELSLNVVNTGLDNAKSDYENIALIVQEMIRERLGIVGGAVNDWTDSRATDLEQVRELFRNVKKYLHGSDRCSAIILDRRTGRASAATELDAIDPDRVELDDITFSPCRPRTSAGSVNGKEPTIKFRGRTVFSHQTKHRRGANASRAFGDVTTRVRLPKGV